MIASIGWRVGGLDEEACLDVAELVEKQFVYRFGVFRLDSENRELQRDGLPVKIQEHPLRVLVQLLQRPGEVVTREELRQKLWPEGTFVEFEDSLNTAVKKLRAVLGDSADNPRFVETIPKRGWRFIAPVKRDTKSGQRAAATGSEAGADKPSSGHSSIAILPFTNLSGNPADEYFSDGISEEIINALAKLEGLRVAARTSSFSFKGRAVEIAEIARKLGVATVLEGSVRKAGQRLRITAQLVNVSDGFHLWSERYDREMEDIFAVQDEIARSIANRLKITLKGEHPVVKARTDNLEAYQFYLKGRALLYQRGRGLPRAMDCFKRAVTLDEKYALAWAGLADAYNMLAWYGFVHPPTSLPLAKEAATRAVALDASLAEAHTALAHSYSFCDWDWLKAEHEFLRALELNPRYVQARDWYGVWFLEAVGGRFEEGIAHAKQAVESDPLSGYATANLAAAYVFAGRSTDGLAVAQHAVELDPESILAQRILGYSLYFQGRFEESVAVGEAALGISGRHPLFMTILALAYSDWGKLEQAKAVHTELVARAAWTYVSPILLATSAAAIGEGDEAMRFACEAYTIRDPQLTTTGKHWPGTVHLREDSRFIEILARMGSEMSSP